MPITEETESEFSYTEKLLDRIAEELGCPVSSFSEPPSGVSAKIDELLRLWSMIQHEDDRTKVLAIIRQTVVTNVAKKVTE